MSNFETSDGSPAGRPPRAFISYRHGEDRDEAVNVAHRAWVGRLVEDLRGRGIEVLWDQNIRDGLSKHCTIDPVELPLCAEISRICPLLCDVFVPIITPAYLERIGIVEGQSVSSMDFGAVFEEWQGALTFVLKGFLDGAPVIRRGQSSELNLSELPFPLIENGIIDFRGDHRQVYEQGFERLCHRILNYRHHDHPFCRIDFHTLCDVYVEWCRATVPGRAHSPADTWPWLTHVHHDFYADLYAQLKEVTVFTADEQLLRIFGSNVPLNTWRQELKEKVEAIPATYHYGELSEAVYWSLRALGGEVGWQYLAKTTEFARRVLATKEVAGTAEKHCYLRNNLGAALLKLAQRHQQSAADLLEQAQGEFTAALAVSPFVDEDLMTVRLHRNIGDGWWERFELTNDSECLNKAHAAYEQAVRLSDLCGTEADGIKEHVLVQLERIRNGIG